MAVLVTTDKLKAIPKGESVTFKANHAGQLQKARSIAAQAWRYYPEWGVRFRCNCNYETLEVTIYADPLPEYKQRAYQKL